MAIFTLEEVREILPDIISCTEHYHTRVNELKNDLAGKTRKTPRDQIKQKIHQQLAAWVNEMHEYGGEVKGPWLVDFDSGDGIYYCWKYGEEDLLFFHRYEKGYKGRRSIEKLKGSYKP